MLKLLEIYACLFIVFALHETGHIIALRLYKCRIVAVTLFYGSIIKIWHRNTFIRIGILPGAYTEAAGTEQLDVYAYFVVCLGGILASGICSGVLLLLSNWYQPTFMLYLKNAFLLDIAVGMLPWGGNDIAKAIKRLKSNSYGTN